MTDTTRTAQPCTNRSHPEHPHHHKGDLGAYKHRHPGCPWDCPEQAYALPVDFTEAAQDAGGDWGGKMTPQDRDAIDGATDALAGIMGHLAGHFAGTADLARQDLEAVTKERDKAVHLLKSMVSILDGMAYTPTFAVNGRDWDDARDFLEAIARDDREG